MPCPNSILAEISPATPRSNTGQQSTEYKLGLGGYFGVAVAITLFLVKNTLLLLFCKLCLLHMMLTCYRVRFLLICFVFLFRQPTQDPPEELRTRDFRRELEERERAAAREKTRERGPRGLF